MNACLLQPRDTRACQTLLSREVSDSDTHDCSSDEGGLWWAPHTLQSQQTVIGCDSTWHNQHRIGCIWQLLDVHLVLAVVDDQSLNVFNNTSSVMCLIFLLRHGKRDETGGEYNHGDPADNWAVKVTWHGPPICNAATYNMWRDAGDASPFPHSDFSLSVPIMWLQTIFVGQPVSAKTVFFTSEWWERTVGES